MTIFLLGLLALAGVVVFSIFVVPWLLIGATLLLMVIDEWRDR